MERHHIYAALAFLALIVWFVWFAPKPQPGAPPTPSPAHSAPSAAPAPPAPVPEAVPAPPPVAAGPVVAAAAIALQEVETGVYKIRFTNQGGSVLSWRLKEFHDSGKAPVELVPDVVRSAQSAKPLQWDLDDVELSKRLNAAPFAVQREHGAEGETLRFRYADGAGLTAEKTFTFRPNAYVVGVQAEVLDRGRAVPVRLAWGPGFEAQDVVRRGSFHYGSQLVRNVGGRVERVRPNKVTSASALDAPGELRWAGLEDQYFAALLIPGANAASRAWPVQVEVPKDEKKPEGEKETRPFPVVSVSVSGRDTRLFVGPKSYPVLRQSGLPPLQVIWFSNFGGVDYMAELLLRFLLWLHAHVVANWGLVIVLATFCLRLVLFPLNQYSMVKMRKAGMQMQRLKPRMDSIKNKYAKKKDAENRAKMNKEIMELYAKEGINPLSQMSGCLPILIQFPVLIAFYNVFTVAVELRGAPFAAWIKDLSLPDPWLITPLLMGGTMFYQQKLAMQKSAMDPTQARMMMFMPLIFTVTFLTLPSGLVLYWLTNNVLGIAQQWLVNRHIARIEPAPQRA